jgi:hypothetical protein
MLKTMLALVAKISVPSVTIVVDVSVLLPRTTMTAPVPHENVSVPDASQTTLCAVLGQNGMPARAHAANEAVCVGVGVDDDMLRADRLGDTVTGDEKDGDSDTARDAASDSAGCEGIGCVGSDCDGGDCDGGGVDDCVGSDCDGSRVDDSVGANVTLDVGAAVALSVGDWLAALCHS